jgi:hypothetical protein
VPLLIAIGIAMGATAGSAAASGDHGKQVNPKVDRLQAQTSSQSQGVPTTMFGITFNLVILQGTGCPPELGKSPYACVEYTGDPPTVYLRDGINPNIRRYAIRHEIGHIYCWRTQADPSEQCADRFAKSKMPRSTKRARK